MGDMTSPATPPRPRQVTLAAGLIMGGSVLVVLTAFDRLAGLHTLETSESIQRFLAEPPGDTLGLGVEGVRTVLRTLGMVAAGCATAAAILGYQVLQRSRSARLGLTLLAVPLFLTGMVTGGFLSSVVAAAAVMLWFQPSRDWFNGVVREAARDTPTAAGSTTSASADAGPEDPPAPTSARPFAGFGAAPSAPVEHEAGQPPAWGVTPSSTTTTTTTRPSAVVWACALTWLFSVLAVLVMATSIAVLVANPTLVFDEMHRQNPELDQQGVSDAMLKTATYIVGGLVIAWSLAAALLAVLVFRRVAWARVLLVVSASLAAALLLVGAVVQIALVLPLAACVVTLAVLIRPDVRAWFD